MNTVSSAFLSSPTPTPPIFPLRGRELLGRAHQFNIRMDLLMDLFKDSQVIFRSSPKQVKLVFDVICDIFCQDGCNPGRDTGEGQSCLPHSMQSFLSYRGKQAVQSFSGLGRNLFNSSLGHMKDPWSKPTHGFTVDIFSLLLFHSNFCRHCYDQAHCSSEVLD